jgi:hypothetical protein
MSKKVEEWRQFADRVQAHISDTEQGHYSHHAIEPLTFMESYLRPDWLCGQVIKYMARYPRTHNDRDLMKAAHYLSRLWMVYHHGNKDTAES